MFKSFKNLFKKKTIMKILVKDYVLTYEDDELIITDNETENDVIKLSGDELGEFKRAIGYLEQEANV